MDRADLKTNKTAVEGAVGQALAALLAAPLDPGLYIVATPIGNLGDMTLRAVAILARADLICCEDTRHSRKLLQHFAIDRPLVPYHEHNEDKERPRVLEAVRAGKAVALISDAGTPLVSDPGFKLVREARSLGLSVFSVPGPSAPMTALAAAGLPTDCFFFEGFLPPKQAGRRARLEALKAIPGTLMFFESAQRLGECLVDMAQVLGSRDAVVARELTKMHEQWKLGPLGELATWAQSAPVKGEIIVLVASAAKTTVTDDEIDERLTEALETSSLRDAAKAIAEDLGVAKGRVYELGLKLRGRLEP